MTRASIRAPWWRRLLAWFLAEEIQRYCAQCHTRLPSQPVDDDREVVCFWCTNLAVIMSRPWNDEDPVTPEEATIRLTSLRREMNDVRNGIVVNETPYRH